jgi:hypothetical protein
METIARVEEASSAYEFVYRKIFVVGGNYRGVEWNNRLVKIRIKDDPFRSVLRGAADHRNDYQHHNQVLSTE